MAKIIWIASYPRSGNTWLRFLLASLLYGEVRSSELLQKLIPDVHRNAIARSIYGERSVAIKTHWAWRPDWPMREDTVGVIHILRNPVDVLESNLRFFARTEIGADGSVPTAAAARQWVARYIERGGAEAWQREGFGTWEQNAASWIESVLPFARLTLRYEAMKADTHAAADAICRFLRIDRDAVAIAEAVERSSAARLRAMEDAEVAARQPGIFYSPQFQDSATADRRFIGGGGAGSAFRLTDDERARANASFAQAMRRFGYAPAASGASSPR